MLPWLGLLKKLRLKPDAKPTPRPVRPARRPLDAQWKSVTAIAHGRLDSIVMSHELQAAASQQIEAAYYGLGLVLNELSAVMTLPQPKLIAAVHRLESAPRNPVPAELEAPAGAKPSRAA